ncbi:hypothetical protein J3458_009306 [Metarhizium acridum]|uniref:uncharacterized protein n=1 Tax=Metarhizium acridum TaxID=92637 RepID=UPI001C6C4E7E|nr:hypothetical protein J3458_009306 [Metarhizium acridum]
MVAMAPPSVICFEEGSQRLRSTSVASSRTLDLENDEPDEGNYANIIDWINDIGNAAETQMPVRTAQQNLMTLAQPSIRAGDVIEVKNTMIGDYRVDFIQVKHISRATLSGRKFRGVPFTRTKNMRGRLPKKVNEVCMMLHFQQANGRTPDDFALLIDIKEDHVVRKRNLIITNATFPEHSVLHGPQSRLSIRSRTQALKRHIEQSGNLCCRWKWMVYLVDNRKDQKVEEEVLERISTEEVLDRQYLVDQEALCNRWRGGRTRGGSWTPDQGSSGQAVDLTHDSSIPEGSSRASNQKYTFFDAFSGAGGVSRGAQNAGFKVTHAIDKSPDVWRTYSLNFPETKLYKWPVDRFIGQTDDSSIRVDVLHMSPPCQYFSPAHTKPCAHDDDNILAQRSCPALVKKLRPRVITIEQTFGLTFDRHRQYFYSLIRGLTELGYSVRWKIVALCTWGLAQTRKRLIIIAAGPGEQLPSFPPATHSEKSKDGLRPYTTIRQVLSRIREGDDLHNLGTVAQFTPRRRASGFDTLLGTIAARWGSLYYPDGTRNFTLREYACLQGFPKIHKFRGTTVGIKSQIGNAFPPSCVKFLYKHLEKRLLQQDRVQSHQPEAEKVVIIDAEVLDTESFDSDSPGAMNLTIDLTDEDVPGLHTSIITSSSFMDLT